MVQFHPEYKSTVSSPHPLFVSFLNAAKNNKKKIMEDNKIDINSLIGFFLIGFIFIGWLWLNPPPEELPSAEIENATSSVQVDANSNNSTSNSLAERVVAKNLMINRKFEFKLKKIQFLKKVKLLK